MRINKTKQYMGTLFEPAREKVPGAGKSKLGLKFWGCVACG
jgi:hypothetical protein